MNEEDKVIFQPYFILIKFLAQQFPDTEFVLHDVSNLENSIIAIQNSHLSGRRVGDSATDLVLRIIQSGEYLEKDYTDMYKSASDKGYFLNSGTFFIKNNNRLIGLLCMNTDMTPLHSVAKAVEDLFSSRKVPLTEDTSEETHFDERLSQSVADIPVETTLQIIREKEYHPKHLNQDERMAVVSELKKRGIFLLKGAIPSVAKALSLSEPSLYRYLGKLK